MFNIIFHFIVWPDNGFYPVDSSPDWEPGPFSTYPDVGPLDDSTYPETGPLAGSIYPETGPVFIILTELNP